MRRKGGRAWVAGASSGGRPASTLTPIKIRVFEARLSGSGQQWMLSISRCSHPTAFSKVPSRNYSKVQHKREGGTESRQGTTFSAILPELSVSGGSSNKHDGIVIMEG